MHSNDLPPDQCFHKNLTQFRVLLRCFEYYLSYTFASANFGSTLSNATQHKSTKPNPVEQSWTMTLQTPTPFILLTSQKYSVLVTVLLFSTILLIRDGKMASSISFFSAINIYILRFFIWYAVLRFEWIENIIKSTFSEAFRIRWVFE